MPQGPRSIRCAWRAIMARVSARRVASAVRRRVWFVPYPGFPKKSWDQVRPGRLGACRSWHAARQAEPDREFGRVCRRPMLSLTALRQNLWVDRDSLGGERGAFRGAGQGMVAAKCRLKVPHDSAAQGRLRGSSGSNDRQGGSPGPRPIIRRRGRPARLPIPLGGSRGFRRLAEFLRR